MAAQRLPAQKAAAESVLQRSTRHGKKQRCGATAAHALPETHGRRAPPAAVVCSHASAARALQRRTVCVGRRFSRTRSARQGSRMSTELESYHACTPAGRKPPAAAANNPDQCAGAVQRAPCARSVACGRTRHMPKCALQLALRAAAELRPAVTRWRCPRILGTCARLFSARSGPIRRLRRSPPAPRTSRPCGSAAARLFSPKRVRAVVESIGLRAARRRGGAGHAAVLERRAGYTRAVLTRDLYRTRLHIARLQLSKGGTGAAHVCRSSTHSQARSRPPRCSTQLRQRDTPRRPPSARHQRTIVMPLPKIAWRHGARTPSGAAPRTHAAAAAAAQVRRREQGSQQRSSARRSLPRRSRRPTMD
jgi:hypothetical protein